MTKTNLCLSLLQASPEGVTTGQFLKAGVGSRYGARIKELRDQGYEIESKRIRDGSWRYKLLREPEVIPEPNPAGIPFASGSQRGLFESPKPSGTRSAVTGEVI